MTPKERRDRLFKKNRPHIRELQILDGDKYHKDIATLWVGHKKNTFRWIKPDLDQAKFAKAIELMASNEDLMVSEDENRHFKDKKGIVGLIVISSDGWKYEPHVQFMPWATKKNVLRTTVAFLQFIRYSKKVGVCCVYALEDSQTLFDKCCEYGVIHKVGKIVNGSPKGDELLYSVRGKKNGV